VEGGPVLIDAAFGGRRMSQLDNSTLPLVTIAVADSIHCVSDPYWHDRLPPLVFRLLAWLQLTALPEYDAAVAIAKLSRDDLTDDDFGSGTLDTVDDWLSKYGLKLQH
jgi:hypothetical protein